jgi:hypothetical protein
LLADVLPRTLSVKHTLQVCLAWNASLMRPDDPESADGLWTLAAEQAVGNRPGRIEPWAVKRRPNFSAPSSLAFASHPCGNSDNSLGQSSSILLVVSSFTLIASIAYTNSISLPAP